MASDTGRGAKGGRSPTNGPAIPRVLKASPNSRINHLVIELFGTWTYGQRIKPGPGSANSVPSGQRGSVCSYQIRADWKTNRSEPIVLIRLDRGPGGSGTQRTERGA